MSGTSDTTLTAFSGNRQITTGAVETLVGELKSRFDRGEAGDVLVFEDRSGKQLDFDLRGTLEEVLARLPSHPFFNPEASRAPRTGPGRPRLGVVSREVSLLPRHWEWLEQQPNGISAALRRLVDEARRGSPEQERARLAREAANRFMVATAGNLPGFEEASRALFGGDRARFEAETAGWPTDVRRYTLRLAEGAFGGAAS